MKLNNFIVFLIQNDLIEGKIKFLYTNNDEVKWVMGMPNSHMILPDFSNFKSGIVRAVVFEDHNIIFSDNGNGVFTAPNNMLASLLVNIVRHNSNVMIKLDTDSAYEDDYYLGKEISGGCSLMVKEMCRVLNDESFRSFIIEIVGKNNYIAVSKPRKLPLQDIQSSQNRLSIIQEIIQHDGQELRHIVYDRSWESGTGWLNHIVKGSPQLKPGQRRKFSMDDGRYGIAIGTRFGNIAFFEHHKSRHATVCNVPTEIDHITMGTLKSTIPNTIVEQLIGTESDNIGHDIERMAKYFK